jgi:hypothetical protein
MNYNGSVVGNLYGGWSPNAQVPAMSGIPEGPPVMPRVVAFEPVAACSPRIGLTAAAIATAAIVLLGVIWLVLPR